MAQNLIRLKQINQSDLSGFVSQLVQDTGFLGNGFVTTTTNQTISGNKTFLQGLYANNLVYNTGDQTISGVKTFNSTGIFLDDVNITGGASKKLTINTNFDLLQIDDLQLSGTDVTLTEGNIYVNGTINSATNLVYNTGDQTISGVKTFNDNIIIKSGAIITGMNYFWFNTGTGGSVTNSDNTITSFYLESGVAYRLESHLTFVAGTNANSISDLNKNPVNFADAIGFRQGSNNSSDLRDAPLSGYLQLGYSSLNGSIWGSISGRTNHIRKGIIRPTGGNGTITFTYGSHNGSNARLTENYILIEKIARI